MLLNLFQVTLKWLVCALGTWVTLGTLTNLSS